MCLGFFVSNKLPSDAAAAAYVPRFEQQYPKESWMWDNERVINARLDCWNIWNNYRKSNWGLIFFYYKVSNPRVKQVLLLYLY